jgi:hypothetical protein
VAYQNVVIYMGTKFAFVRRQTQNVLGNPVVKDLRTIDNRKAPLKTHIPLRIQRMAGCTSNGF